MIDVELSKKDVQILIRSLEHCMATCEKKLAKKTAVCKDCDTAGELKKRLARSLEA